VAAAVVRVVDGDTLVVRLDGRDQRVRYIGVNTPESVDPRRPVQCFGQEAAARNRELVDGQTVWLERDVSDADQFGRLLRYVYVGERLVNAELVRDGFAHAVTFPPDVKYADRLRALEREARAARRGLWGRC
jgi:micrococcal nuclease